MDLRPHLVHASLSPPESTPQTARHLNWFSRFSTARGCNQQAHTDHATSAATAISYALHSDAAQ